MAFDNVTLFEINFEEFPFGGAASDESEAESVEISEASDEAAEESGGRGKKAVGLLFGAVVLVVVARQVAKRRGSDDTAEFETEEVEPGVERVDA